MFWKLYFLGTNKFQMKLNISVAQRIEYFLIWDNNLNFTKNIVGFLSRVLCFWLKSSSILHCKIRVSRAEFRAAELKAEPRWWGTAPEPRWSQVSSFLALDFRVLTLWLYFSWAKSRAPYLKDLVKRSVSYASYQKSYTLSFVLVNLKTSSPMQIKYILWLSIHPPLNDVSF